MKWLFTYLNNLTYLTFNLFIRYFFIQILCKIMDQGAERMIDC